MKIEVIIEKEQSEKLIKIYCNELTPEVEKIISTLKNIDSSIIGKKDNENFVLKLEDIYYFEAVENKVFAYLEEDVYEVSYKIAELNDLLDKYDQNGLIKLVLTGGHKVDYEIDVKGLSSRLNEKFFFAKVYDNTYLKVSKEDYENDKSVRGEFIREVLSSDLPQEKKDAVIKVGLRALRGEEI